MIFAVTSVTFRQIEKYGNPEHHARKVVAKQSIKGNIVFRDMVGLRTLLFSEYY